MEKKTLNLENVKWDDHIEPFYPPTITTIINMDGPTEMPKNRAAALPIKNRNGQDYMTVTLGDHSMFDRYYKGDLLNIRLTDTCENGQDALVVLYDGHVRFRQVFFENDGIVLKPLNTDFYTSENHPQNHFWILGVVAGVLRIN